MLRSLRSFLELIRFSHTIFALPFALTSAALAWRTQGVFHPLELAGILLCMIFARSAAMAFNRLVDRNFDAANPRTAGRHLPAGILSVGVVWAWTIACTAGFVLSTLLFWHLGNPWPLQLSGPVLVFLCAYSLTKRFTALSHFWLGASLFLAPVAAWIAIRGILPWPDLRVPLLLGGAVLFWVAGFDILYACQDVDFDRQAKLRSVPASLGVKASLRVALFCHLLMLALLVGLYAACDALGSIYLVGITCVAVLLAYEHWLVRPDDLSRVNQAFFQVNGVISVGLFVLVLVQLAARMRQRCLPRAAIQSALYIDCGRYELHPEYQRGKLKGKGEELILGTGRRGLDFYDKPDGELLHLQNWIDCVRSGKTPTALVGGGVSAAAAAHLANQALRKGRVATWNS